MGRKFETFAKVDVCTVLVKNRCQSANSETDKREKKKGKSHVLCRFFSKQLLCIVVSCDVCPTWHFV